MTSNIVFEKRVDDHAPELYRSYGRPEAVQGWELWGADAKTRYERDGFLVVRNAIPTDLCADALDELRSMATAEDPMCSTVAYEGELRTLLEERIGGALDDATAEQRSEALAAIEAPRRAALIRKFMGFTKTHAPLGTIASFEPLRRAVEELAGEPTRLFQSMALVKPPRGREKPWHQDHAYFDLPIDARVCGVWIALGEVTEENGAMFMLPGGHTKGPIVHFMRRDWQICDTEMAGARPVSLPMQTGDLVIFDAKIPHGTPTNRTNQQRWALQFHYVARSAEKVAQEYRLGIFGEEGKDVSC